MVDILLSIWCFAFKANQSHLPSCSSNGDWAFQKLTFERPAFMYKGKKMFCEVIKQTAMLEFKNSTTPVWCYCLKLLFSLLSAKRTSEISLFKDHVTCYKVLVQIYPFLPKILATRKYSCRMRTTRLPTVHALVSPPDVSTVEGKSSSEVNKFEQVPSDGHEMSLAGGSHDWCLRVGWGRGPAHHG